MGGKNIIVIQYNDINSVLMSAVDCDEKTAEHYYIIVSVVDTKKNIIIIIIINT